ncbi:hypothetical protein MUK42_36813 [Musa troglodytarum]|uniref:Uncharacterized protein n=1 Tax=Musa troglodytarum TaxID=320322 RepID=A0A9E7HKC8_9LILI|nr:hypothetical protein MUK42_36813 [Musa troglodytarum]
MATYNVKLITPDGEFNIVPGRHVHPGPGGGGGHRPAVLVPRRVVLVVRRQDRPGAAGPVGRQLPRRRPDRRRLRAHLRCLPHVRPRYRDSQGGGARRLTVGGGEDGSRMILTAYSPPFLSHHQDSCHDDI